LTELRRAIETVTNSEIEIFIWKNRTESEFESSDGFPDDSNWIYLHADEVMYLAVKKNRNSNAAYLSHPEKYKKQIEEWSRKTLDG
jgi:hypothetical protein